ncbi:MAG: alanine--tRNA ligase-related protein, partial [Candidatus Harrisonbacteria bacterium]|nr:alanine--tRNA ligase-related protein [Candidatus Harrisonbacteria bacterium]
MDISEVRDRYLSFFKARQHAEIPSASLLPENDPTTLLTGSGMQPLIPYLLGQEHPSGTKLVNAQKCFRAEDIDEVGDNRHTTFFEMLGNWSLGDYFKAEQIAWIGEFFFDEIKLDPSRLYISCFGGDREFGLEKDEESAQLWQEIFKKRGLESEIVEIGREEEAAQKGMQGGRIFYYGSGKNWWSRSGRPADMPAGEPGGQSNEYFYDFGTEHDRSFGEHCHLNCDCGRFMEIGNSVFMQYLKQEDGSFKTLPKRNVDFGGGLERIAAAKNDNADIFQLPTLKAIVDAIAQQAKTNYSQHQKELRILADHLRAAAFLVADGAQPSNKERGYILRRLIRRAGFTFSQIVEKSSDWIHQPLEAIALHYQNQYPELSQKTEQIEKTIKGELDKFFSTLEEGQKVFEKLSQNGSISKEDAFNLFATFGFPLEMTLSLAQQKGIEVDTEGFYEEFKKHQELSKTDKQFKGGLADHSGKTTALHTATHLMLAGLRKYLGEEVHQAGSNI